MTKTQQLDEDHGCGKCGKTVSDDQAIYCDGLCKKWYDLSCAKLRVDEYQAVSNLASKVKWYCTQCNKYIADLMKMKMVQNKEDWPSILNIVLSSIESNSETTLILAERIEAMEKQKSETRLVITQLREEVRYLREVVSDGKNNLGLNMTGGKTDVQSQIESRNTSLRRVSGSDSEASINGEMECRPTSEIDLFSTDGQKLSFASVAKKPRQKRSSSQQVSIIEPTNPGKRNIKNSTEHSQHGISRNQGTKPKPMLTRTIFGSAQNSNKLVAATKNTWIFVSRLDTKVTEEDLNEYVSTLCDGKQVTCEMLNTRFKTYKSFKVGVPDNYFEGLMTGDVWPEGVLVCKYRSPRPKWNQNQHRPTFAYSPKN